MVKISLRLCVAARERNNLTDNMIKSIITGINGYVGTHLAKLLSGKNNKVFGIDINSNNCIGNERFYVADILNTNELIGILLKVKPDVIYHLAGIIKSDNPLRLYEANVNGTLSLFEAIVSSGLKPKVFIPGSSAVYGKGDSDERLNELSPLLPCTSYGMSKLLQEEVAKYYFRNYSIPVYIARTFNIIGPGNSVNLACSEFARQIALAEKSGKNELHTGTLSSKRDFVDIRDAVKAYHLIVKKGKAGNIYNVCSGKSMAVKECLDILIKNADCKINVICDKRKIQKNDIPVQVGSPDKICNEIGWETEIPAGESLKECLEYWRENIK